MVKIQKCHLVSGRGGKQEAKLRSSTYHSTRFCHMKSELSILGISETYLGSLDPSESAYRKRSPALELFCLPDAGFILKAFFKYRAGNEVVKLLQTDIKTICFKRNQTMLLTVYNVRCSTVLLRMQLGDSSHTLYKMPRRYKPKFH